ncbi:MAG: dihydroorotase [Planctomycetota bacterium]|jgi:dihydroorotase
MDSISLTRPDDFHLHLRDTAALSSVIGDTARQFARAIVMPNLKPPITTVAQAEAYRQRIIGCLPKDNDFQPLMTLYLTDNTSTDEISRSAEHAHIYAVKYYPAGATTNSDMGVTSLEKVYPILERMSELSLPLLMHGEVTDSSVDIFDRERVFIERVLEPLMRRFVDLRIVFEHITTKDAADYVQKGPDNLAATITPQHLIYNRNAIFQFGIRPHNYCLPVLKRELHRQALLDVIASGHPRFFLGTDSAPHARGDKENSCGCAGVYSAHNALELYATVFDELGKLDKLEAFSSQYGADFYGLERNTGQVTLEKTDWTVPTSLAFADSEIVPFKAGEICPWKMVSS